MLLKKNFLNSSTHSQISAAIFFSFSLSIFPPFLSLTPVCVLDFGDWVTGLLNIFETV